MDKLTPIDIRKNISLLKTRISDLFEEIIVAENPTNKNLNYFMKVLVTCPLSSGKENNVFSSTLKLSLHKINLLKAVLILSITICLVYFYLTKLNFLNSIRCQIIQFKLFYLLKGLLNPNKYRSKCESITRKIDIKELPPLQKPVYSLRPGST